MKILVWGLGYLGSVTASCLAHLGYEVIGIDSNVSKVQKIIAGRSPVKEHGLESLIRTAVSDGRLRASSDGISLVASADVSLICVGAPPNADGSLMLEHVCKVASDIAVGLRKSKSYHVVAVRTTVFPGTVRNIIRKVLDTESRRVAGLDFGLVMNPAFIRETTGIEDFYNPPYTIVGAIDSPSGDLLEEMFSPIAAPLYRVSVEEAEFIKLCNNAFHALKVSFANEVGRLCDRLNIDSKTIMGLACSDTKLNISSAYLTPGFAFGGSCLPKDIRALTHHAHLLGVELPVLEAVLPSNNLEINSARTKILQTGAQRVGILGLSFKPRTDDLRESPILRLIRDLTQRGIDLLVHDPDVRPDEMLPKDREYLEREIPQIHQIFCHDLKEVFQNSETIVVTQRRPEFLTALKGLNGQVVVVDVVGMSKDSAPSNSPDRTAWWS